MAGRLSSRKVSRIFQMHFRGYSQWSVASRLDIDQSTVSIYVSRFTALAEREGLETAARRYGIMDEIRDLHSLAAELKKARLTAEESRAGLRILEMVKNHGVTEEEYGNFIESVKKMKSEGFVQAAQELTSLERSVGKTYTDIVSDYQNRHSDIKKLDEYRNTLKVECTTLQGEKKALAQDIKKLAAAKREQQQAIQRLRNEAKQEQLKIQGEVDQRMKEANLTYKRIEELRPLSDTLKKLDISDDELEIYLKQHQLLEERGITWENFKILLEAMRNETGKD